MNALQTTLTMRLNTLKTYVTKNDAEVKHNLTQFKKENLEVIQLKKTQANREMRC